MFETLLPNFFKKVGLAILILSFVLMLFSKNFGLLSIQGVNIISIVGLIGFGLLINSKEKEEDERTMLCRYKALGKASKFVFVMLLFMRIFQLLEPIPTSLPLGFFNVSFWVYYANFELTLRNKS